jgi:hypothetical protein
LRLEHGKGKNRRRVEVGNGELPEERVVAQIQGKDRTIENELLPFQESD